MFYTGKPKSQFFRKFLGWYAAAALIGLSFLGGFYFGGRSDAARSPAAREGGEVKGKGEPPPYLFKDVDFNLFWDVWNLTREHYLEQPVLDTQLFYGALSGIVASLNDPYSVFLDPETTRKFTEELAGVFEGIGAEIGIRRERLVVVAPLPATPADRAGLKSGDHIVKIDEKDTLGMPLDIAVSNIRGAGGSTVVLTMFREGWKEPREVPLVRETINVDSVRFEEKDGGVDYIRLIYFNEKTPQILEETVQKILSKDTKGIILDLRNNPGGFLEVGVKAASYWVPTGEVIVWQEFQGGRRDAFRAQNNPRLKSIPTVVLINEGSASASEIVAGALQDHGAAKIVGEQSFGKGSVQSFEQLRGGSALKLTVAHRLTPDGHQIEGQGITPDVLVEMTRDDLDNGDDPQLEKAIELLKK